MDYLPPHYHITYLYTIILLTSTLLDYLPLHYHITYLYTIILLTS